MADEIVQQRLTGALPSPRHVLAATSPYHIVGATPTSWIWLPRTLSMWNNNVKGCCVTSEEAFARACSGILISDQVVYDWAQRHNVLNGAVISDVLDWMGAPNGGFQQDGNVYGAGGKLGIDYTNAAVLCNAISKGPVKIGVAARQLQRAVGAQNGWFGVGFGRDDNLDHCVSLNGFGTLAWLAQVLGVIVPSDVDGLVLGYALSTWNTVGIVDVPSMVNITGEAWWRNPTTTVVGTNPPTPDNVFTPAVVPPPVPTPTPVPTPVPIPVPVPARLFGLDFRQHPRRRGQVVTFTTPVDLTGVVDVVIVAQPSIAVDPTGAVPVLP
jgi:hypothetical protein